MLLTFHHQWTWLRKNKSIHPFKNCQNLFFFLLSRCISVSCRSTRGPFTAQRTWGLFFQRRFVFGVDLLIKPRADSYHVTADLQQQSCLSSIRANIKWCTHLCDWSTEAVSSRENSVSCHWLWWQSQPDDESSSSFFGGNAMRKLILSCLDQEPWLFQKMAQQTFSAFFIVVSSTQQTVEVIAPVKESDTYDGYFSARMKGKKNANR